jgi:hypothetical protein
MALAARSLIRASPNSHRKRVLGRYVFVYLHDVVRFGASWRNAVRKNERTRPAADAALPALKRLRQDWLRYQDVRHYIGAKRQPRDLSDAAVDELESFRLWADIGELAVDTLTADAVEFYAQLDAVTHLAPINYEPGCPKDVTTALAQLDPVGEEGFLEASTTSFGAAKGESFTIRMGDDIGRLVPLINDVAENLQTLRALVPIVGSEPALDRLLRCQVPSEVDELLRLSIGSPDPTQDPRPSLLSLYDEPGAPPETVKSLKQFRDSISSQTRVGLRDWRDRIGAHVDDETPWSELEAGIEAMNLGPLLGLLDHSLLCLEATACTPGGPLPLLLPARRLQGLKVSAEQTPQPLSYADPDADSEVVGLQAARPPKHVDSPYAVWVGGPMGSVLTGAVAGMVTGRARDLDARLKERQANGRSPRGRR